MKRADFFDGRGGYRRGINVTCCRTFVRICARFTVMRDYCNMHPDAKLDSRGDCRECRKWVNDRLIEEQALRAQRLDAEMDARQRRKDRSDRMFPFD